MNSWMTYLSMEYKKSMHLMKKMFVSFCLLLVVLTAGSIIATAVLSKANVLSKVQVAVVIPEDEDQTRMVVRFASTLDSVQSLCAFSYFDSREVALQELKDGRLQACIVFPDNFYENVDKGVNTPATVLVTDRPGLSEQLFRGLIRNGVRLLQTAETGVYAVLDVAEQYQPKLPMDKIGDLMLQMYVEQLFNGSRLFTQTVVSPLQSYELSEYVFGAILLLTVLMPGLCMGYFYRPGQRALEQKLRIMGINAWKLSVIRVVVMSSMLWIFFLIFYIGGCLITFFGGWTIVYWSMEIVLGAFFLCVALACIFHGIYACCGDVGAGTVIVLLAQLWMILGSGMLIPMDFMPLPMQKIGVHMHLTAWSNYLMSLLYDYEGFDYRSAWWIFIYAVPAFGLGVFGLWKHTSFGGKYS